MDTFDIVIIGGGINGAGIAKVTSQHGLQTALFEKNDFASGTSSASTKLIHGGLRYLKDFQFSLVHKALKERQILLETYPEIIEPIKFTFNIGKNPLKYLYYRAGLFIYDYLYVGNKLPKTKTIWEDGFNLEFYDCKVDDCRLVITNLMEAEAFGANISNYHEVIAIEESEEHFIIKIKNNKTNELSEAKTRCIVNAAGPWVKRIDRLTDFSNDFPTIQLVRGSHIIVENRYDIKKNYFIETEDKRTIFVIQYLNKYLLIGTTEIETNEEYLENQETGSEESVYLINAVNEALKTNLKDDDIIYRFTGTRALHDDKNNTLNQLSRDYRLSSKIKGNTLYLSVLGGKITTYRKLSSDAYKIISTALPRKNQPNHQKYPEIEDLKKRNIGLKNLYKKYREQNNTNIEKLVKAIIQEEQVKEFDDLVLRRTKLQIILSKEHLSEIKNKFFN